MAVIQLVPAMPSEVAEPVQKQLQEAAAKDAEIAHLKKQLAQSRKNFDAVCIDYETQLERVSEKLKQNKCLIIIHSESQNLKLLSKLV